MSKYRQLITGAKLFLEKDKLENVPDSIALWSLPLSLSWFGAAGVFIMQEYRDSASAIGNELVGLLFLVAIIINCSFLIRSLHSFLFAGAGMGSTGFLFALPLFERWLNYGLIWRIAGDEGEQVVMVLGFLLTCLFSLSLTLLLLRFQAGNSRIWVRHTLLTVQCFLLTISILLMFKHGELAATPGGVTLAWAIVTLLFIPVFLAAVLWHARQYDEQAKRKIFWAAFTVQLIVAIGAVYYYAVSPVVRHLGQPVDVREIRLGVGTLSPPFVEEGAAYLVSGDGRLHEVNLLTGREQILAHISLPEPAEMGYPGYRGGVGLTEGSIARKAQDELALKAVYSLWSETDQGSQVKYLALEITVNQVSGQVSWRPKGYIASPGYSLPKPAEGAGITIFPPVFDGLRDFFPMRISGAGVETTITPKGRVLWTYAGQGWLLAGTDQGVLYTIDVGFHLVPDEI